MYDSPYSADDSLWVIWNGSFGILDTVSIGSIEIASGSRNAWLEEPYDMVGPFDLDELETHGKIHFEACIVMSRQRWQDDQVGLRRESIRLRREAQERLFEAQARYNQRHFQQAAPDHRHNEKQHREVLKLPIDGRLEPAQIKAAFRRQAQKAHPDVGGSHELFVRITEARNALLERAS